ncbi:MAG: F0F1 ATP synthase subunit epsilon [Gemmatimonadota bacterium]
MEGKTLTLRLVSPVATVFEGEITSAVLPAWDGKVGILPGHAPFLALLGGGTLEVDLPGGGSRQFFVVRGVVKVEGDRVTVLSEYAGTEPPAGYDPRQAWLDPQEFEDTSTGNPGH